MFTVSFVVLSSGCKKEGRNAENQRTKTYNELGFSDVLVKIDDDQITKGDLEQEAKLRFHLFRLKRPRIKAEELERSGVTSRSSLFRELQLGLMVVHAARKAGIHLTPGDLQAAQEKYVKTFAKPGQTFQDLINSVGPDSLRLKQRLENEQLVEAFLNRFYADKLAVPEQTIDKILDHIKTYNHEAQLTNDWAYVQATNVWKMAKTGMDFAKLADKYSEDADKNPGGDMGECEAVDFSDDPEYWKAISSLKTGEISDVIETDIGLEVVKCLGHVAKSENTGNPAVRLARIYIRRPMFYKHYTRDQVRKIATREFRQDVMSVLTTNLMRHARIVYPNGKNALPFVVKPERKPMVLKTEK